MDNNEKADMFSIEFGKLVRKYVPVYPKTDSQMDLLYMLGDKTSVFNPLVWSEDCAPGKRRPK